MAAGLAASEEKMRSPGFSAAGATVLAAASQRPGQPLVFSLANQAAAKVGNYRLSGTILAVTLEPCLMCLGAMIHARVGLLVYGATDPRTGVVDSRLPGPDLPFFNHRFDVVSGIMAGECGGLLREFFREKRRGGAGCGPCPGK